MASVLHDLERFVRAALTQGATKLQIRQGLLEAGWPDDQAKTALAAFADIDFPVPIPKPRPYLSAREAFFYLLMFTALYLSAYHLGCVLFQLVNIRFPDPATPGYAWMSPLASIRWSVSSIVVAFPLYLLLATRLHREQVRNPVKRLSGIRRWLTYITLFVTASFLLGDVTTLVYNVLGGELTVRFVLKVIVVGVIAGGIFGFYLWDLRSEEREI